tara:strand:- start:111 stop:461 length:351 start_codon:yes stop_codon:yes gene_type:complete
MMEQIETATITIGNDDGDTKEVRMSLPLPKESTPGPWVAEHPENARQTFIRIRAQQDVAGVPDPIVAVIPVNSHDAERIALIPQMVELMKEIAVLNDFATARRAQGLLDKLTNPGE